MTVREAGNDVVVDVEIIGVMIFCFQVWHRM